MEEIFLSKNRLLVEMDMQIPPDTRTRPPPHEGLDVEDLNEGYFSTNIHPSIDTLTLFSHFTYLFILIQIRPSINNQSSVISDSGSFSSAQIHFVTI